jgi:hypothetical protein
MFIFGGIAVKLYIFRQICKFIFGGIAIKIGSPSPISNSNEEIAVYNVYPPDHSYVV